jgi:hypothetical protein
MSKSFFLKSVEATRDDHVIDNSSNNATLTFGPRSPFKPGYRERSEMIERRDILKPVMTHIFFILRTKSDKKVFVKGDAKLP